MSPAVRRAAAGVALLAACASASAQLRVRTVDDVSRPAEKGPSRYVGGVAGGLLPQDPGTRPFDATRRNVGTIGERPFAFRNNTRATPYSSMVPMPTLGVAPTVGGGRNPFSLLVGRGEDAETISGLAEAKRLDLPPLTLGPGGLPAIDAYRFTPQPPRNEFQSLLALTPPPDPSPPRAPTVLEALEAHNRERAQRALAEGLALYRRATVEAPIRDPVRDLLRYPNCTTCSVDLQRAVALLEVPHHLDPQAHLPALLIAHGLLESNRLQSAAAYLLVAFERNPGLLARRDELLAYLGDARGGRSEYLEAQLRAADAASRRLQGTVNGRVIEAYCAWRLNDMPHAREAAAALARLAAEQAGGAYSLPQAFADALLAQP